MVMTMKKMMKDAAILLAITVIAGLFLGGVYQITKAPIAQAEEKAANEAYQTVFPMAARFAAPESPDLAAGMVVEGFAGVAIDKVLEALDESGEILGYVLQITSHEGYGGDITLSLGVRMDGTCNGIAILKISETAGLGMKAEPDLVPQFTEKKAVEFTLAQGEAGGDGAIDAISGATITSEAFVTAVNAGLSYFRTELGGDGNEP